MTTTRSLSNRSANFVSPRDFGAKADGLTDDTVALQQAVSYAQSAGKDIRLDAAAYRVTGTITVSGPVNIHGQGVEDFEKNRPITRPQKGTWFIHANSSGPLFQFSSNLATGAGLWDFGIFQEGHPTPAAGWAPATRDWVIRNENTEGTLNLRRVHFHNVYKGVLTDYANRPRYEDITGQFFYRAFQFDRIYDIGKLEGLHAWTYWSENDYVLQWQQANGIALNFYRADGMWLDRIFTFALKDAVHVNESIYGGTSRVIVINGLYADFTGRAVVVESPTSPVHVQIANMFHLGQAWPPATPPTVLSGAAAVDVISGSNHLLQIGSMFAVLSDASAIKIAGTNNQIWIDSEVIEQYDRSGSGVGAHTAAATNLIKLGTAPSLAKYGGGAAAEIAGAAAGLVFLPTAQQFVGTDTVNRIITAAAAAGNLAVVTAQGEATAGVAVVAASTGIVGLASATNALSFYGGASATKGAVTGSKGGNAALASLITYLAARGLLTDSTT